MKDLPTTESAALQELEEMLDIDHDGALAILQRYPHLLTFRMGASKRKTLHHVLLSPFSSRLDLIQAIYGLWKAHNLEDDEDDKQRGNESTNTTTALHAACMSQYATDEVIQFIFDTNPLSAFNVNAQGFSPLVYLFMDHRSPTGTPRSAPRLSALRRLLEACPECVKVPSVATGREGALIDLLATAMSLGCPREVYELLWEHYQSTTFRLCPDYHVEAVRLGRPQAHTLCQTMLPHLTTLVVQPQEWADNHSMDLLCQHLTTNTTVQELDISLTTDIMTQESCQLWSTLLQRNTTLRKVKIQAETHQMVRLPGNRMVQTFRSLVSNHDSNKDTPLLQCILQGLQYNNALEELELSCFKFPTTPLPSSCSLPSPAHDNPHTSSPSPAHDNPHTSSIKNLRLTHCYIPAYEWLHGFCFLAAPSLQEITTTFRQEPTAPQPDDMTDTLVHMLDSSRFPCLESITIGKPDPSARYCIARQVPKILQALQRNTSVRYLSVHFLFEKALRPLEELFQRGGNTTLYDIRYPSFGECLYSPWEECSEDGHPEALGRIPYYLLWNQYGRYRAHQSDCTKPDLVELVSRINKATPEELPRVHQDMLYDMLLETPGIWDGV